MSRAAALLALERWRHYRRFFPDRRADGGEVRRSMLWVQASFAVNLALFWGFLGPAGKPLLAAGVMAWTFGDAAVRTAPVATATDLLGPVLVAS